MKTIRFLSLCMLVGATAAQSQDIYPENTTVRDYAKRDRLLIGGLQYVSPSQLHENEGLRARIGGQVQNSDQRKQGVESTLNTPSINAEVAYGWQSLTLGLQGSYLDADNEADGEQTAREEFEAQRIMPQVAYTFGSNFTAGIGVEFNTLDVTETLATQNEFSYEFQRGIAGLAYHNPRFEIGLAYTSEVQADDQAGGLIERQGTLSLASSAAPNERDIYLPAMGTVYARGNLTDTMSLLGSVSLSRYDGNVTGAIPLFEEYNNQDRLAARLMGTYWTNARSRVSLAAEYKGAATTAIGTEEAGLGYRLANLYGGSLEGVLSLNRQTYIGLNGSFMRGERADTEAVSNVRYSSSEESTRFSGFVTVKM